VNPLGSPFDVVFSSEYRAKREAFLKQIKKVTAFAMGDTNEMIRYLPLNPGEDTYTFNQRPKLIRNIVKRVLSEYLNGVSALPVKRSVSISTTRVVQSIPDFNLNPFVRNYDSTKIQTRMEIEGTVAIKPIIEDGEIFYQVFGADELVPVVDEKTGRLIQLGLHYKMSGVDNLEVWDRFTVSFYENGVLKSTNPNPYFTIPLSIFKSSPHPSNFWGVSDLTPIVDNANTINRMLTDLRQLSAEQSFSIYVYTGPLPDESDRTSSEPSAGSEPIKIGTGRMLTLPQGGNLKTVAPEAAIEAVNNVIDEQTRAIYEDALVMVLEKGSQYSSGFSIRIKKEPYLRKMAQKRLSFGKSEERLLELAVLIADVEAQGPSELNPDFKVKVEFDESQLTPETAQEDLLYDQFNLTNNIVTPVDLIIEDRNVDRKEAEQIYEDNKKINNSSTVPEVSVSVNGTETMMNKSSMPANQEPYY